MDFQIGDYVTRKSYNNDTIFKIINIKDGIYYLKGVEVRLYADSTFSDLTKCEEPEDLFEGERQAKEGNKDDYFYLPGKILHIDADIHLNNKVAKPYKIRVLTKLGNHKKSLKRQKIGNFH